MSTIDPTTIAGASPTAKAASKQDAFGKDAFMKLLVEQMKHQSPTDPSDGQQWINQMTQFSMLEQLQQQSAGQQKSNAAAYLGRTVSWATPDGHTGSGVVENVDFTGDQPTLTVAGTGGITIGDVLDVR
jgi:flagellar basal-body rod modification protein FlgD